MSNEITLNATLAYADSELASISLQLPQDTLASITTKKFVYAKQNIGITEVSEKIWLVSFMQYDLGFFDHESGRVECAPNPFGAKLLPMCPV